MYRRAATRDTGIAFATTRRRQVANREGIGPEGLMWRIREAGVVIERNLCTDSSVGVIVEKDARAVVRDNRASVEA